jgi:hypothetical protein
MDYEEVYSANGQLEADMVRLMLEASGVKVIMRGEAAGSVYGLTVGPLGEVKLFVPADQMATAQGLIAAMNRGDLEKDLEDYPEDNDQDDEENEKS